MQRFWSYIAVQLGKHAVVVTVVGLLVTIALGLGITQLNFATGQDSYLNKNDQVYKDNVVYQRLFGGEAMLTVISMDPGHKIDELFTGDGAAAAEELPRPAEGERRGRVGGEPAHHPAILRHPGVEPRRQPDQQRRGQGAARGAGEGAARVARRGRTRPRTR